MTDQTTNQKKSEGHGLWVKFYALRTSILAYLEEGVSDNDPRITQARQTQRKVAERLVRGGHAKGIGLEREGDVHREQQVMAKVFDEMPAKIAAEEYDKDKPPAQIVKLKTLKFKMKSGRIGTIAAPPNQVVRMETLRAESKAATIHNRTESVMEGKEGVDYITDVDPDTDLEFYIPITDR